MLRCIKMHLHPRQVCLRVAIKPEPPRPSYIMNNITIEKKEGRRSSRSACADLSSVDSSSGVVAEACVSYVAGLESEE